MSQGDPLFRYLYLSRLADGLDFSSFKAIVNVSRQHNAAYGITGALLFDGERFCQLIEGPEAAVQKLAGRINADPRHTRVVVLNAAADDGPRRVNGWTNGYCDADDLEVFAGDSGLRGPAALDAFGQVLARADLAN